MRRDVLAARGGEESPPDTQERGALMPGSSQDLSCRAQGEGGTALLMMLIALFAIGLMAMVIAQVASTELAITANITAGTTAFLPADGASQVLLRDVISMARSLGRFEYVVFMVAGQSAKHQTAHERGDESRGVNPAFI